MKVLFTSALIKNYYREREKEYIDSYKALCSIITNVNDIYIIECYSQQEDTFLNLFNGRVHYFHPHKDSFNKGVKEAMCLIDFISNKYFLYFNNIFKADNKKPA